MQTVSLWSHIVSDILVTNCRFFSCDGTTIGPFFLKISTHNWIGCNIEHSLQHKDAGNGRIFRSFYEPKPNRQKRGSTKTRSHWDSRWSERDRKRLPGHKQVRLLNTVGLKANTGDDEADA